MSDLPGSDGEHELQRELETAERASGFYEESMYEELTPRMQQFLADRIMFFLATADADGHTDCSPRLGPRGFVNVLAADVVAYPEYRGTGFTRRSATSPRTRTRASRSSTGGRRPSDSISTGRLPFTMSLKGQSTPPAPIGRRCGSVSRSRRRISTARNTSRGSPSTRSTRRGGPTTGPRRWPASSRRLRIPTRRRRTVRVNSDDDNSAV